MTNIKVFEIFGKKVGKKAVILAGVHGNESFGIKVIEKIMPKLKIKNGKVTFIIANLEAIKQNKRCIDKNLNRCFFKSQPFEIAKSLEGKTAKEIIPYLDKADYLLDIHATFAHNSIPFVICEKQSFDFAQCLPFNIISRGWDNVHPGSTDYYMNLQNKIGICIECGRYDDIRNFKVAEKSVTAFLQKAKIIDGTPKIFEDQDFIDVISIYKNKNQRFKKSREFNDFEILKQRTLIGLDGNEKVYANKGDIILFVMDTKNPQEECFLIAKQTNKNNLLLNKLRRGN